MQNSAKLPRSALVCMTRIFMSWRRMPCKAMQACRRSVLTETGLIDTGLLGCDPNRLCIHGVGLVSQQERLDMLGRQ